MKPCGARLSSTVHATCIHVCPSASRPSTQILTTTAEGGSGSLSYTTYGLNIALGIAVAFNEIDFQRDTMPVFFIYVSPPSHPSLFGTARGHRSVFGPVCAPTYSTLWRGAWSADACRGRGVYLEAFLLAADRPPTPPSPLLAITHLASTHAAPSRPPPFRYASFPISMPALARRSHRGPWQQAHPPPPTRHPAPRADDTFILFFLFFHELLTTRLYALTLSLAPLCVLHRPHRCGPQWPCPLHPKSPSSPFPSTMTFGKSAPATPAAPTPSQSPLSQRQTRKATN